MSLLIAVLQLLAALVTLTAAIISLVSKTRTSDSDKKERR